jgi:sucrose-phosphate synthase
MMRGNPLAVVVANRHDEELAQLDEGAQVYFSEQSHAAGVLDALRYYQFLDDLEGSNA